MLICICHLASYLLTYLLNYLFNLSQHYDGDVDVTYSSFAYFRACCDSPTRACKIVAAFILFYFILLQVSAFVQHKLQFILLQNLFYFIAHEITASQEETRLILVIGVCVFNKVSQLVRKQRNDISVLENLRLVLLQNCLGTCSMQLEETRICVNLKHKQ